MIRLANKTAADEADKARAQGIEVEPLVLPVIRFHDLRHTAATLRLIQGDNPKVVQELLGHSQISLTLDTYSHVIPTMQKESAARLDGLFRKNA